MTSSIQSRNIPAFAIVVDDRESLDVYFDGGPALRDVWRWLLRIMGRIPLNCLSRNLGS